jgi:hypothetical protein
MKTDTQLSSPDFENAKALRHAFKLIAYRHQIACQENNLQFERFISPSSPYIPFNLTASRQS